MKYAFLLLALALLPFGAAEAASDYYLKIDGVRGETTAAPAPTTRVIGPIEAEPADDVAPPPQEGSTDAFIKFGGVEGESTKGEIEHEWKVEEGESAAEAPEAGDVAAPSQRVTPDFSILLGGGGGSEEEAQATRDRIGEILLKGAQEAGAPVEQVSLNFEKIRTKARQSLKLFGFIPVTAVADVDIDAEKRVSVRFPWWAFLASGKDKEGLGQRIFDTLTKVMQESDALTDGLLIIRY